VKHVLNLIGFALLLCVWGCNKNDVHVRYLRCEYRVNPIGIDAKHPRFSWEVEADRRAVKQSAYQLLIASDSNLLNEEEADRWNSGKVNSDAAFSISYRGQELRSGEQSFWKVRIWDEKGQVSDWSTVQSFRMGLLNPEDWKAQWIGFDEGRVIPKGVKPWVVRKKRRDKPAYIAMPIAYLRRDFECSDVEEGILNITALGMYEVYINGSKVSKDLYTPGWTDYEKRILYQTYDVSAFLIAGKNTIALKLADGWYSGNMADRGQFHYGHHPRVKAQLALSSGSVKQLIVTDASWRATHGPLLESDLIAGEVYDARLEKDGWCLPSGSTDDWRPVNVVDTITAPLYAYNGAGIQAFDRIEPFEFTQIASNKYLINFGQNLAGFVQLRVSGNRGDSVHMRFGERLNEDGSLHTRNLRSARASDTYVLKGEGVEAWEPSFTYHGFQYAEITTSIQLSADQLHAIALRAHTPEVSQFSCSDPLINRIRENILWSQRSNYLEVPTDCPQRDERLGWTGDAQLFMSTAMFQTDLASFYEKWVTDILDGQYENGRMPSTAPKIYLRVAMGWGDAGVIMPYLFYQNYGDTSMLRRCLPAMELWMDYLASHHDGYISTMDSYGDWQHVKEETPIPLLATAFHKHDADLLAEMAMVLGEQEKSAHYAALSDSIATAFRVHFIGEDQRLKTPTQTAYLLALNFGLYENEHERSAAHHLMEMIEENGYALTTGIIGTSMLLPTLSKLGAGALALRLLQSTAYPSWGYQIAQGATTTWERWNGVTDTSGFHSDSTNSLNHYAMGSCGQWLYAHLAGIRAQAPGYKEIEIAPYVQGSISWAEASYQSISGLIRCRWERDGNHLSVALSIPPNTSGWLCLPVKSLAENGVAMQNVDGVKEVQSLDGLLRVRLGSGTYQFEGELIGL
jgi:alpha-L-rhamnosidase